MTKKIKIKREMDKYLLLITKHTNSWRKRTKQS